MIPSISLDGLKGLKWWEHALRFGFGGLIAVGAALIGEHFGPSVGGLFLAFPAILPASITLVKRHDGRRQAVDDARGARIGAVALVGFAAVTLSLHGHGAIVSLSCAVLTWFAISFLLWFVVYGLEHSRSVD